MSAPRTIDVHAHYLPERYRKALLDNGHGRPDGFPQIPAWSAEEHVAVMDRLGIATSLLSISSPGVHLADAADRDRAREVNEAGRRAVVDHPGRFGLFASLPLPDVDAALAEIAYCCERLDVVGFTLLTNIGGTYLGDSAFQPVFRELDRRGARLFIHPTSPACCGRLDTQRHRRQAPRDRAHRPARRGDAADGRRPGEHVLPVARRRSRGGRAGDLGRLHFDLAGFPVPRQLDALLTLTTLEHLHYGSDYPFTPEFAAAMARERLAEVGDPPGSLLDALRANTERLFAALGADRT